MDLNNMAVSMDNLLAAVQKNPDGTVTLRFIESINGAALVSDAISLSGNAQGTVSMSTTAAQSAALTGGVYDVWSDVDCYIKVAATANDVTTSTGYLLRANNTIPILVPDQEKLGGIVAYGTGTLSYHRVK